MNWTICRIDYKIQFGHKVSHWISHSTHWLKKRGNKTDWIEFQRHGSKPLWLSEKAWLKHVTFCAKKENKFFFSPSLSHVAATQRNHLEFWFGESLQFSSLEGTIFRRERTPFKCSNRKFCRLFGQKNLFSSMRVSVMKKTYKITGISWLCKTSSKGLRRSLDSKIHWWNKLYHTSLYATNKNPQIISLCVDINATQHFIYLTHIHYSWIHRDACLYFVTRT